MIQHIVLLKFKPAVFQETIAGLFAQLAQLQPRIPGMTSFSGGPYTSDEGLNQGYTHSFIITFLIMTFIDAEARNHYLPHPEHQHVKTAILPAVGDVIAFDFQGP